MICAEIVSLLKDLVLSGAAITGAVHENLAHTFHFINRVHVFSSELTLNGLVISCGAKRRQLHRLVRR